MRRRAFIAAGGATLIQWETPALAQQPGRTYRLAILGVLKLPASIQLRADRVIEQALLARSLHPWALAVQSMTVMGLTPISLQSL